MTQTANIYENATLCPTCMDLVVAGGFCRMCMGTDYGVAKPAEIDETWVREGSSNGVVVYSKDDVIWVCDLRSNWFRYGPSAA